MRYNTRNHRKITVVDGKIAYTGGVNLADEYINAIVKHGHWKDMAVRLEGEAVWSFAVMYLTMWDFLNNSATDPKMYQYLWSQDAQPKKKGFVQPFSDHPLDKERVGETIYMNMINKAKHYVFITTPYHPDKKLVQVLTRSFYPLLIRSGVKIFEYEPGFMHGKTFVVDDKYAVVGTVSVSFFKTRYFWMFAEI